MPANQAQPSSDEWRSRSAPVEEDIPLQRRFWRAQAFGWALLTALLAAAALGLFSEGPLSRTTARSPDGALAVDYQRFTRRGAAAAITVSFKGANAAQRELVFSHSLLRNLTFEIIRPEPVRAVMRGEGLQMVFASAAGEPLVVHIAMRPRGFGSVDGWIRAGGGTARLRFFIYP